MRVAFIVTTFPRLSETFILSQITGLIDRGHEVDIFAERPSGEPKVHHEVTRYGLMKHTRYYNPYQTMPRNKAQRLVEGLQFAASQLPSHGRTLARTLNVFQHRKEAASLRMLYMVKPFLEAKPYDIVHCHFGPNGRFGIKLKELGAINGRIITAFHGYDVTAYVRKNGAAVYRKLFAQGDCFLPISERMRNALIELGCDAHSIRVHHMGIDTSRFRLMPRRLEGAPVRILTVARLVEKKGVEYALRAIAKLVETHQNIEYRVVGDGPLHASLAQLVKELQIEPYVTLLGWRQQDEVLGLMDRAHIMLTPSVTAANGDQEGIPVVLMEALASGMPVVSTQHSGIPELVRDGESGFLVPERDIDAMAAKLAWLIDHPERWPEMGQAGRRHVEASFDNDKLNDQLVDLYQQVLQRS